MLSPTGARPTKTPQVVSKNTRPLVKKRKVTTTATANTTSATTATVGGVGKRIKKPSKTLPPTLATEAAPTTTAPPSNVIAAKIDLQEAASHLVSIMHTFSTGEHLELEAKLGRWKGDKFVSGVAEKTFRAIEAKLNTYTKWVGGTPQLWKTSFDYMLDKQVRVTKTNQGNTFIRKTPMEHVTYKANSRPYDVRVSLKEERPVAVQLPQEPQMVRVKRRKSFNYKNTWRFDLTVVWTGSNEQEAQSRPPTYEVECEYVADPRAIQNAPYVAQSLLEKMVDFLGRDQPLALVRVQ